MDRFSTLQMFVRVVDRGSFTQAARELGLGQPAVSKQMAALEARLGAQLLSRTSRGLRPTAAGHDLYDSAVRLLSDLEEAESRIGRSSISPSGVVRVAPPPAVGRLHIVPRLPAFFARFPDVRVELSVSERRVDLMREGVDFAVRIGPLDDSALVARRIGSMRTRTFATPDYLARHGTPGDPSELRSHNLLAGQFQGITVDWQFTGPEGPILVEPEGNFRSNDADDLRAAVLAGLGIGHGASALFDADLREGRVIGILQGFAPNPIPIQAVCPSGRRIPQRSRVFMDFLADIFAAEPSLCIG